MARWPRPALIMHGQRRNLDVAVSFIIWARTVVLAVAAVTCSLALLVYIINAAWIFFGDPATMLQLAALHSQWLVPHPVAGMRAGGCVCSRNKSVNCVLCGCSHTVLQFTVIPSTRHYSYCYYMYTAL